MEVRCVSTTHGIRQVNGTQQFHRVLLDFLSQPVLNLIQYQSRKKRIKNNKYTIQLSYYVQKTTKTDIQFVISTITEIKMYFN